MISDNEKAEKIKEIDIDKLMNLNVEVIINGTIVPIKGTRYIDKTLFILL